MAIRPHSELISVSLEKSKTVYPYPSDKTPKEASFGNPGDVKCVGENVWEMREFFGPDWRMSHTQREETLIVILGGGDKSTQSVDIARAIELAATLED